MKRTLFPTALLLSMGLWCLAPCLPGCQPSADEAGNASEAADSLETTSTEGALLALATDGVTMSMSPEQMAGNAVANAARVLTPTNCVTASAAGGVATYKLAGCAGPYGLIKVSGTLTLTFGSAASGVTVAGKATALSVNGATLNLAGSGVLTLTGSTRKLTVMTSTDGTGTRGNDIQRSGSYSVSWDGSCITLDGSWSTAAAGRTWSSSVSGYKHCTGMCPAAGGSLVYAGGLGTTLTLTCNGDNTAKWMTSTGKTGTVVISCAN